MDRLQEFSLFELIKGVIFTMLCAAFLIPFVQYDTSTNILSLKSSPPDDALVLILCFMFTVFFEALQRRSLNHKYQRKIDTIIFNIEIGIGLVVLPATLFFYGIRVSFALSVIAIICSTLFFSLKILYLTKFLFKTQKNENI